MPCILILVKSETNTRGTTLSVCHAEKCDGVWPGKYDYAAVLQMLPVCTFHVTHAWSPKTHPQCNVGEMA